MVEKGSVMQTGVDRLLEILRTETSLSVKEAAVKLGVSTSAVLEWAKLLEEEGQVKITYRFATAYIEGKNLSSQETVKARRELASEKDLLDEKLEGTNNFLITLENEVSSLREIFSEIGKHVSSNMTSLKSTLAQMERLQQKKEITDRKILTAKSSYAGKLEELNKRLGKHQGTSKEWYEQMYGEVLRGGEVLQLEQAQLDLIQDNEKLIEHRLADMQSLLDVNVINSIAENKPELEKIRKTLIAIKRKYVSMKAEAEAEKAELLKLIIENEKTVAQLEKTQQDLVAKLDASASDFDVTENDLKDLPRKMRDFFSKKNMVDTILNRIHYNEFQFRKRLQELRTRSNQLGKVASLEKFRGELRSLEDEVQDLSKKREYFTREMKTLVGVLRSQANSPMASVEPRPLKLGITKPRLKRKGPSAADMVKEAVSIERPMPKPGLSAEELVAEVTHEALPKRTLPTAEELVRFASSRRKPHIKPHVPLKSRSRQKARPAHRATKKRKR
jgi:transposase